MAVYDTAKRGWMINYVLTANQYNREALFAELRSETGTND